MTTSSAFLAFSSARVDQTELLLRAAGRITQEHGIDLLPWTELNIGGQVMVNRICEEIAKRDLFICDLTDLNHNVLFELGFAIAQRRRTWILLNDAIDSSASSFKRFSVLSTVGYIPYQNSTHIVDRFASDLPHLRTQTLFSELIEQQLIANEQTLRRSDIRALLYLQSPVSTEASIALSREVYHSKLPHWLDDPAESPMQSLGWYAKHVFNSHALVAHFLSPDHKEWFVNNAKMALVAGLAFGFERKLLMLAHGPYESTPLDYRDLLYVHNTAQQCELRAKEWIDNLRDPILEQVTVARRRRSRTGATGSLQRISLGEYISENEPENLSEYFVETAEYSEAFRSKHAVVVGRKGAGKTATLLMLRDQLQEDKRNHVCVIKPVSYEFHGLVQLLEKAQSHAETSYLFESLWKFLIYSELAASVYDSIRKRPVYISLNDDEKLFLDYMERSSDILLDPFSLRLERAVERLHGMSVMSSIPEQRRRISELLHEEVLAEARKYLGNLLTNKERVVVLIDNLDKAWVRGPTLDTLGAALFRLMSVTQSITRDFDRSDHWRDPVNLSVVTFLRSDIFNHIHRSAREPDKITPIVLRWDDRELLVRVIEERLLRSLPQITNPEDVWGKLFIESVRGVPTRKYISEVVLPRPRDMILLIKEALGNAVNRRHTTITEQDLLDAEIRYSQHAFDSLVVEASSQFENIDNVLLEFAGREAIVELDDVASAIVGAGVSSENAERCIELLVNLSFLGLETAPGEFTFFADQNENERVKTHMVAKRFRQTERAPQRYRVNRPFWAFLEILETEAAMEAGDSSSG